MTASILSSMSGLLFVNRNLVESFRRSRPSRVSLCRTARSGQGRASARRSGPLPASTVRLCSTFDGRRSGNSFPWVSFELCLRLPCAVVMIPTVGIAARGVPVGKLALQSVPRARFRDSETGSA